MDITRIKALYTDSERSWTQWAGGIRCNSKYDLGTSATATATWWSPIPRDKMQCKTFLVSASQTFTVYDTVVLAAPDGSKMERRGCSALSGLLLLIFYVERHWSWCGAHSKGFTDRCLQRRFEAASVL